ncbi:hypothetical protein M8C21_030080 [Ambrosia artemisiifolia]|uniref:Transcription factor UNE10-like protein n=1 Tax=Ambrosia artemisiifolia TaxID=4212 RepID=A0AAD5GI26_AMBAR|nr:hypothetical protein M8C21_030080 [Ambrosia artemisiifolia]
MSASTGSPENTSSGRDCSNSTFPDHTTASHRRTSQTDKASMLDEVIEHIKQLHVQLHAVNMMNMSPMMMSLVMQQQQQQLQLQKSMMNTMGMGMGMGMTGMGMGMGGMDMNTIGASNIPARFHPSAFMQMPSWNNQTVDQVNTNTPAAGPMPPFLASRPTPLNMESYSRMAALYQQMQNQSCGPYPKN